ncbi:MAG: hypothetical protein KDD64_06785 [Bdellovibrionales bacterium]|nr:hypothetical protein [Bdellovibrionales bacterium]
MQQQYSEPTPSPSHLENSSLRTPAVQRLVDIERKKALLPEQVEPFTDKYFLRTREILEREGLNPTVRAQVFVRKGPGEIGGINEALAMIEKYSSFIENGGKVFALEDGDQFEPKETLMVFEGPLLDLVVLETVYLGAITRATTAANGGPEHVNLDRVRERVREIVEAAEGRPVSYFGARHWHLEEDPMIARAAFDGGASSCSTDAGAATFGQEGIGTIPHVLENAFAALYGKDRAVVEATKAFDRVIDPSVPRIALIDYNNREIDDSLAVAEELGSRLAGVRVDTPGENVAQGALASRNCAEVLTWEAEGLFLPQASDPYAKFWFGSGVTVTGVYALRKALDAAGRSDVKIVLTSGFGDPEKVKAFVDAEKKLGVKLFDSLGVGGVYPSRAATMDVVGVESSPGEFAPLSKTGRAYSPNPRLELVLGDS